MFKHIKTLRKPIGMGPSNPNLVIIFGPSLSAVSGVSTHLNQLFSSTLGKEFSLVHFQVGSQGREENLLQRIQRLIGSLIALSVKIVILHPAIIHLNPSMDLKSLWRDAAYLFISKVFKCKVIYQLHGGDFPGDFCKGKPFMKNFLKIVLRSPDVIVLLSSVVKRAYEDFCPGLPLRVIPNAIDLRPHSECEPKNFQNDRVNLVYIGRLAEDKGVFEAIEAMFLLKDKSISRKLHFYVAGSGPAESSLRVRAKRLGLMDKISFLGPVFGEEKIKFWQAADIFLFPTHHEGLPYAILESLASATPVITTGVGGIPEVVEDGTHGVFVKPRDSQGLALAIRSLLGDKSRLQYMSKQCKKRALEYYGINRLANQFSELYDEILAI